MADTAGSQEYKLELKRTFNATRERLFKAWTDPNTLRTWMSPSSEHKCTGVEIDLRVGGKYSIAILDSDGDTVIGSGVYTEISPPSRIAFTWNWNISSVQKDESLITVDLADVGGKTEMTFVHFKLASEESARRHTLGWTGCLDSLVRYVDGAGD